MGDAGANQQPTPEDELPTAETGAEPQADPEEESGQPAKDGSGGVAQPDTKFHG